MIFVIIIDIKVNTYREWIKREYFVEANKHKNHFIELISGTLISSIPVYLVLSYLLTPAKFTFPLAAVMGIISFGLIRVLFHKTQQKHQQ